jgi:RNA polymerase sigma-70 factor, ECF subfamily
MKNGELDPAILLRARRGDPPAFRALYQHHADAVHGFLVRMLGEATAAEDALQESFLRVLGALGRFDPRGPARLSTWIFTIARRVALNALERRRLERRPATSLQPPASRPEQHDLRLELTAAVEALPDALRTTFVLRACCALSYEEVAAVEGVDLGTVKSRLHRARAALQASLRDPSEQDEDERRRHESRP